MSLPQPISPWLQPIIRKTQSITLTKYKESTSYHTPIWVKSVIFWHTLPYEIAPLTFFSCNWQHALAANYCYRKGFIWSPLTSSYQQSYVVHRKQQDFLFMNFIMKSSLGHKIPSQEMLWHFKNQKNFKKC